MLIVGNEYCFLTAEQYEALQGLGSSIPGDLLRNFFEGPDGWYAPIDDIDSEEEDFLLQNDWFNPIEYRKSTQPGGKD